ncbi:Protein IMPACT-like protein [Golovinomyces cichoracearum]|uniref:Protein IMPACT-like protein n=1 Tax=Golovinomyces cichoracearum TaxID=62708 RepID=A0A420ID74_9PEZI|nr:Protein IMPACT-like protein [Golovinomyces cichoracearum]
MAANEDTDINEVNDQLAQEIMAINAIYGEKTMRPMKATKTSSSIFTIGHGESKEEGEKEEEGNDEKKKEDKKSIYVIHLPRQDIWLKIYFPATYPDPDPSLDKKDGVEKKEIHQTNSGKPLVLGTYKCGVTIRKGDAVQICARFEDVLTRVYRPGEVCLFDVMEEMSLVETTISTTAAAASPPSKNFEPSTSIEREDSSECNTNLSLMSIQPQRPLPLWSISEPIRELKSVFIARSALIKTITDVYRFRECLLNENKKVAAATHNIMAWRIRMPAPKNGTSTCNSAFINSGHDRREEDYDDDGESAAGSRLLHLMQLMDVWDVLVIVSRWYGGTNLGPRRFTLINSVARDSLLKLADSLTSISNTTHK